MTGKVIQGSFLGGQPKLPPPVPARLPSPIQAKTSSRPPGPPAPAFAVRPPGPPAPAFTGRQGIVQRHGAGGAFAVEAGPLGLSLGGGRPLPETVRGKMEAALGANFSDVRVHVGPQAERIGAIAFTVGSDIYFAPGRFQPDTAHGQQLLGHELAHVVQQRAGRVRNPLGSGLAVVQDHALEAEADRLGHRAAAHRIEVQAKPMPGAVQPSVPVRISPPVSAGPGSYRLTAGAGGRQVGSVMVYARDRGVVEVTDLGVDQTQRGHGIGQMLVASAARTGLQFGRSKVTLAAQDKGSGHLTRWYKEMGFTQTGVNQRGFPQLEAPISRVLAGTAQRKMQWQTIQNRACFRTARTKPPIATGAAQRAPLSSLQANSTGGFQFAPILQRFAPVVQMMEAWGYCQSCGKPVPGPRDKCRHCGGKIGPHHTSTIREDPQNHAGFEMFEFHEAKIKGQIFDQSILNLNCGRYCATSAIEFWFPGITQDVLKELLPKPKSNALGVRYGWSPGKEGAEFHTPTF